MRGREVLWLEGVVEHPLVVGVGLELGAEGGLRPAVEGRVDPLHLHVGPLDDADRDGAAAGGDAVAGPGRDPPLPAVGVGHVGLQRDAGPHPGEPRSRERLHEGLGGERQVAVFLHVEVEELGHAAAVLPDELGVGGGAVEQLEPVAEPPERVLAGDGEDLRVDRGDLHRQHLHVGRLEGREVLLEPHDGLVLAEERLAEEVEIHPQPLAAAGGEMLVEQFGLGGQDDVGRLVLEVGLDERHRHRRQPVAERLEAEQQGLVERAEEPRDALHVEDVGELLGGTCGSMRPKRLIGELDERRLVGRVPEHPVELGLLPALGG